MKKNQEIISQGQDFRSKRKGNRDFPGSAVVKNPPANAQDMGSIPGPGRPHMLWSN